MSHPFKPPRLYLRRARGDRSAVWVIKHRGVEYSTGAGKGDLAKAQAALIAFLTNERQSQFGKGNPDQVLIADVLKLYGERHAPTTRRPEIIGLAIDKLTDFWQGNTCKAITPDSCNQYVTWRTAQRDARAKKNPGKFIKPATARRELVVLAAALEWCHRERKLDRPVPVSLPEQSEPREIHLTRPEAARLLAAALGWYRDKEGNLKRNQFRINRHLARFILVGLYTGTRHDAILKLQWQGNTFGGWIDLESLILYRRPIDAADSKKRRKTIPLPPKLVPHLRRWRKLTARYVIEWQGGPIASQERRAWSGAREMAGLDARYTPHVLRHTCATWLLQRGVSIYDVAGVLGCSEEVVRRTYGHHAHENLRNAVAAFSRR